MEAMKLSGRVNRRGTAWTRALGLLWEILSDRYKTNAVHSGCDQRYHRVLSTFTKKCWKGHSKKGSRHGRKSGSSHCNDRLWRSRRNLRPGPCRGRHRRGGARFPFQRSGVARGDAGEGEEPETFALLTF